jgi:hypothetical protein
MKGEKGVGVRVKRGHDCTVRIKVSDLWPGCYPEVPHSTVPLGPTKHNHFQCEMRPGYQQPSLLPFFDSLYYLYDTLLSNSGGGRPAGAHTQQ